MDPRRNIARKRKLARRIVTRERYRQNHQRPIYVGQMKCPCAAHARPRCRYCKGTGTILFE